jgi:hypothetical protein
VTTAALPPKPVVKPSTKMKQFNWTKIPNNKVISSYWKDVTEVNIDLDPNEVERLFAAKEAVKKGAQLTPPCRACREPCVSCRVRWCVWRVSCC